MIIIIIVLLIIIFFMFLQPLGITLKTTPEKLQWQTYVLRSNAYLFKFRTVSGAYVLLLI